MENLLTVSLLLCTWGGGILIILGCLSALALWRRMAQEGVLDE